MADTEIIYKSRLFQGMDHHRAQAALALLHARTATYEKGEIIHQAGEPFFEFGLVLAGSVMVCTDDLEGNRVIMVNVAPGVTFGDSLTFLGVKEPQVYALASEDSRVMWLSLTELFKGTTDRDVLELQKRFTGMLAQRTLEMNARIQILSKLTLREKIIAFLGSPEVTREKGEYVANMSRQDMADYLGTNRSALSRELARMKKDGVLDYRMDRFRIL